MSDTPFPDRLSTNPKSPHYDEALLQKGVGIKFDGQEKTNVEEYCISEGWIRVAVGTTKDRRGDPLTMKLQGVVEPYLKALEDRSPRPARRASSPAPLRPAQADPERGGGWVMPAVVSHRSSSSGPVAQPHSAGVHLPGVDELELGRRSSVLKEAPAVAE